MTGHKNPIIAAVTALLTASAKRQEKQHSLFEKKFLETLDKRVDAAVEKRLSAMKDNSSGMSPAEVSKLKQEIKSEVSVSALMELKGVATEILDGINKERAAMSKAAEELKGIYADVIKLVKEFETVAKDSKSATVEFSQDYLPSVESFIRSSKRIVGGAMILSTTAVAACIGTIFLGTTTGLAFIIAGLAALSIYGYFTREKRRH